MTSKNARNVYLPDEAWRALQQLAANEGARLGRPVSVSEYIRLLVEREQAKAARRSKR